MFDLRSALLLAALLTGCGTTDSSNRPAPNAWTAEFTPPMRLETEHMVLEPLAPSHTEMDFAAAQGSREHLQRTLHWGNWPSADMTVDDNRRDLVRHIGEFERHEAYAYTVLSPDRTVCLGCVYLNPWDGSGDDPRGPRDSRLAFWVTEPQLENDLDEHLVRSMLGWIDEHFPLDTVTFFIHRDDARSARILEELDLAELLSSRQTHRQFEWRRG